MPRVDGKERDGPDVEVDGTAELEQGPVDVAQRQVAENIDR